MKSALTISAIGHTLFLAWGIISFAATPLKTEPTESLPVDIVSTTEFSKMTAGVKTAPKVEAPKPLAEKVAPKTDVKDPTPKVVENKPEIEASADTAATPPPPMPEPKPKQKPPEPKPPEAKPEKVEKKPDPIAEAIKQEKPNEKPKPEKEEAAQKQAQEVPTPQKRPPRPEAKPEPKFDAGKVAALLDKRAPQRLASAGETINTKPSLGTATGASAVLSQTDMDALKARMRECWIVPAGVANAKDLIIDVDISFRPDGSLASDPVVSNRSSHPAFQVGAESALRAIRKCAPFSFLSPARYDTWKRLTLGFDPRDML